VRNFVKAGFNVAFDDPGEAAIGCLLAPMHGVVRIPVGPKPVGIVVKFNFKNGFQRHPYSLLDNFVPQARYPKLTHFAISLGNFYPP